MKRLSVSNTLQALAPPVVLLLALTVYLATIQKPSTSSQYALSILFYVVLAAWGYGVMRNTFDLYYDDHFLYLKGILSQRKVPLQAIAKIELTNTKVSVLGITSWKYNVQFDPTLAMSDQSVWQPIGSKSLDEFEAVVRQQNAGVIVQHSSV